MIKKNFIASIFYILLTLLITGAVNYISLRHYIKKDITKNRLYTLDSKSNAIASNLQTDINIYAYFNPSHELNIMLKNLLNAYETFSDRINVFWIDPYRDFEIIKSLGPLSDKFKLNSILIKSENRHRFLSPGELANYDRKLEQFGIPPKLVNFSGENAITGALIDMSESTPPLIGLINNHGERNPNQTSGEGISSFIKLLTAEGYKVSFISLKNMPEIPEKVNILMSIQPKMDYTDQELSLLYKWLLKGGKLFMAVDPLVNPATKDMMDYNLNPLFKKFGVAIDNTIVIDPSKQIPYSRPDNLYIDSYTDFQIVKNIKGMSTLFFQSRSLSFEKQEDVIVYPLVSTTQSGWGETDYKKSEYNFSEDTDIIGPSFLGAASHNIKANGKLIVFGDSDFLSNIQISNPGNMRLAQNCFYWLSENTHLLNIPPKQSNEVIVTLERKQLIYVFLLSVVLPPLFVILLGALIWWKRK